MSNSEFHPNFTSGEGQVGTEAVPPVFAQTMPDGQQGMFIRASNFSVAAMGDTGNMVVGVLMGTGAGLGLGLFYPITPQEARDTAQGLIELADDIEAGRL